MILEIFLPERASGHRYWRIEEAFGDETKFKECGFGYWSFFWTLIKLCARKN